MQIKIRCYAHKTLCCNIMHNSCNWKQPECPAQEQGTLRLAAKGYDSRERGVVWNEKREAPTCEASESVVYINEHVHGAWKETRRAQPSNIGECSFSVSYFLKISIFKEARIT